MSQLKPVKAHHEVEMTAPFINDLLHFLWSHTVEVEILQLREGRARWRTNQPCWLEFFHKTPCFLPIRCPVKVPVLAAGSLCSDVESMQSLDVKVSSWALCHVKNSTAAIDLDKRGLAIR